MNGDSRNGKSGMVNRGMKILRLNLHRPLYPIKYWHKHHPGFPRF
jgi:hypothetical protein